MGAGWKNGREAASDTRSGEGQERRRRHDHLALDLHQTQTRPSVRLRPRPDSGPEIGRTPCTSLRPLAVTTAVHHPIKSLTAEIIC